MPTVNRHSNVLRTVIRRCIASTLLTVLFGVFGSAAAFGQVSVTASVEETTVGMEDVVRFAIDVSGVPPSSVETPSPPDLQGLALISPNPMTSQSVSYVNGEVSQSISFRWRLQPMTEGTVQIGRTSVVVEGKAYTTEPISIEIVPGSRDARSQRGSNHPLGNLLLDEDRNVEPREITKQDLFIQARPSARSVYRNQQILIDYDLYFREGIQLRGSRLSDSWHAEGFWREDLDLADQQEVRGEVIEGLRYRVVTLKRVAVFPTRTGPLEIDPLRIESEAAVPIRSRSIFSPLISPARFQPVTITSSPINITSNPLPDNAPPGFTGAVGNFDMDVEVDRSAVEIGETIKMTVRLSGTGNIATLAAPALDLPPFIEQFEPQVHDAINRKRRRVSGSKSFSFVLVPSTPGEHVLPAVRFSFYDPASSRYESIVSNPIPIQVSGGPAAPVTSITSLSGWPANDIAPPLAAGASSWISSTRPPLVASKWPYAAIVLPLLLLAGLYVARKRQDRLTTNISFARGKRAHPVARKHLREAEKLLEAGEPKALYQSIARALEGFVGDRLNVAGHAITAARRDELLTGRGVDEAIRSELRSLLAECDRVRFAPVPPAASAMETATDRAATLIAALDKCLPRPKPGKA